MEECANPLSGGLPINTHVLELLDVHIPVCGRRQGYLLTELLGEFLEHGDVCR